VTGTRGVRKRLFALTLALTVAFLAAPSPASAQFVRTESGGRGPGARFIELTDAREKQLDAIFNRTRPRLIDLKASGKARVRFQTAMEGLDDRPAESLPPASKRAGGPWKAQKGSCSWSST
jgi:hypothetical protein